jgi:hypothetical protein
MSLNVDHNSNLSRKKVSHYGKIVNMCQFYSDSSRFFATNCTIASMEFRTAIYMSFKKNQCSLSFIVINVIIINFEGTSK